MYCFAKICCLCLQHNRELNKLDEMDQHGLTFFEKLLVLIPEFGELVKKSIPNYLCRKCKRYVNKFYKFQQNCLKSYKLLESYVHQLDTSNEEPENNIIEDDLILIKEDMEACLKNIGTYIKIEESDHETTSAPTTNPRRMDTSPLVNGTSPSPGETANFRKRTREHSKISYNEDYDSDSMFSDSEVYLTKRMKRTKTRKELDSAQKQDKTVVIPQNDIFAKDLTRTINDIIARLSTAGSDNTNTPDEVKVKFKNSSGNTEQLSIYREGDSVEIRFTKEEKLGYLKVSRQGESIILTHNMSGSSELQDFVNLREVLPLEDTLEEYMNLQEMSCKICDKVFEDVAELRRHIQVHAAATPTGSTPATTTVTDTVTDTDSPSVESSLESPKEDVIKAEVVTSPRSSQCREMKVLLSSVQEPPVKSERSSSPEYEFHLSDDSEDDNYDNDTLILGSLDNGDDFQDTRSPSPVELGTQVLQFLAETDTPNNSVREAEETPLPLCLNEEASPSSAQNKESPLEDKKALSEEKESPPEPTEAAAIAAPTETPEAPTVNGNDSSFEEKLLKIVVNKLEVEDFIKQMAKAKPKVRQKRYSPRRHPNGRTPSPTRVWCTLCKKGYVTQQNLERHLQRNHRLFTSKLEA